MRAEGAQPSPFSRAVRFVGGGGSLVSVVGACNPLEKKHPPKILVPGLVHLHLVEFTVRTLRKKEHLVIRYPINGAIPKFEIG